MGLCVALEFIVIVWISYTTKTMWNVSSNL